MFREGATGQTSSQESPVSTSARIIRMALIWTTLLSSLLGTFLGTAHATSAAVGWAPSGDATVVGYRLYYGTASGTYPVALTVGNVFSATLTGLLPSTRYYFTVTSFTSAGTESVYASEVSAVTPGSDSDGDGLSDQDEASRGTNPNLADTDLDGVSDGAEVAAGTDPLERSSNKRQRTRICSDWNGAYDGTMWNILELEDVTTSAYESAVEMYNNFGILVRLDPVPLAPYGTQHLLIHEYAERVINTYGSLCVTWNGPANAVQGRVSYYKKNVTTTAAAPTKKTKSKTKSRRKSSPPPSRPKVYEFAFSNALDTGLIGDQFASVSTMNLSNAAADAQNPVTNWVQVVNRGTRVCSGTMRFHQESDGLTIGDTTFSLAPGGRYDVPAHQFPTPWRGQVSWRPSAGCLDVPFQIQNTRYYANNAIGAQTFSTAYPVAARYGSGQVLAAPVSAEGMTSEIEIRNTSDLSITVHLELNTETGLNKSRQTFALSPLAGTKIRLDTYLASGARGVVRVWSESRSSLMADVIQVRRSSTGQIISAYGVPALPGAEGTTTNSYNAYLSQVNRLALANNTAVAQSVVVDVVRSDGRVLAAGQVINLSPRGAYVWTLNPITGADNYGQVIVRSQPRGVSAWMLRERTNEYVMYVPGMVS